MPRPILQGLVLICRSCGNPDFRQNPNQRISPTQRFAVKSIEAASVAVRDYIDKYDIGGGNWIGGQVLQDGLPYAYISYNGSAWKPGTRTYYSNVDAGRPASERFMGGDEPFS